VAAISEHFIQNQPTRVAEQEAHTILAVRPAGANLVRTARATGFNTTQLTNAIQRFTDPIANKTVRTGVMSALQTSPALSLEIQRALENSDQSLEIQREQYLIEAREADESTPIADRITSSLNNGVPLEKNIRRLLEAYFNTDLSRVRVHTDGTAHELAKKTNAIAFTTGQHIFFQAGKYNPESSSGFELLAHEVTHTIQQDKGLVSAGIDSSPSLESAAVLEGQRAVANRSVLESKVNNFNN
jgi:hypothetical protein